MHNKSAQKSGLYRALILFVIGGVVSPLGCVLEDLPEVGVPCPLGIQKFNEGEDIYVTMDHLDCYEEKFVTYESPYAEDIGQEEQQCCELLEDDTGREYWSCKIGGKCLENVYASFDDEVKACRAYQKKSFFDPETAKPLFYTSKCESEDNCTPVEGSELYCPLEYDRCIITDQYEFACLKYCSAPNIYCMDESTDNRGNKCINPNKDMWHCGARGSCAESTREEDSPGDICLNGMICENGQCVCPKDYESCGGKCVNIKTSPETCGNCDTKCDANEACLNGVCTQVECTDACSEAGCKNLTEQCGRNCIDCKGLPNQDPKSESICNADKGICQIDKCLEGFHLTEDKTACEINTVKSCGHASGDDIVVHNCEEEMPFGEERYCSTKGECKARACKDDPDTGDVYTLDETGKCTSACALCKKENHEVCSEDKKGCRCEYGYAFCPKDGERGVCVKLLDNDEYCGSCTNKCGENETCEHAQCKAKS